MPLASGNTWTYQAGIVYTMNGPVGAGGQTTYGYQGGCQEREFYYKDASQDLYSIGQNPTGGLTPSTLYPSPELILKGAMVNGDHWQNNLGFTTEFVSVAGPVNVTINGAATPGWTLTYTDTQAGSTPNVITYVANIGAVQVTDYCVSPSAQRTLTGDTISPTSS